MGWFRIELTEEQQRIVQRERTAHPHPRVREKMLVLWLLHCGTTRETAARVAGVARSTVQRYVQAFRSGGLDGLRQWNVQGPVSDLAAFREAIRESFEQQPVATIAEACTRIEQLTGLRRGPTQVRRFLKGLGLKWQRLRALPVPPKKTWRNTFANRPAFSTTS
jgi:transposase